MTLNKLVSGKGESVRRYNTDGPECPHCGNVETPDEGYYYDESTTSLECGDCCKPYDVRIYNSTSWTTSLPGKSA